MTPSDPRHDNYVKLLSELSSQELYESYKKSAYYKAFEYEKDTPNTLPPLRLAIKMLEFKYVEEGT